MLQHTSLMICISTEHEIFGLSMHVICRLETIRLRHGTTRKERASLKVA